MPSVIDLPPAVARFLARARARRAARAQARQLAYQTAKSRHLPADTAALEAALGADAERVRALIARVGGEAAADGPVLEVGSGAHGLVFFLGRRGAVGVDPLARDYARLFPGWQRRARTMAGRGEALPFRDEAFDLVLSDNVVDHAEAPAQIAREMVRVLAPGGLLYFTVNVHHVMYDAASRLHGVWTALGVALEIGPFADHTVHLTPAGARALFARHPLRVLHEDDGVAAAEALARSFAPRGLSDRLKRWFFKNAVYELVARKEA